METQELKEGIEAIVDGQSFACLSSRFVYGETISKEKLSMVDRAEQLLLDIGFHQVRVRIHGSIARIEILPFEFEKILQGEIRKEIYEKFQSFGFSYVTLDLLGYRTGSMNETLRKNPQYMVLPFTERISCEG